MKVATTILFILLIAQIVLAEEKAKFGTGNTKTGSDVSNGGKAIGGQDGSAEGGGANATSGSVSGEININIPEQNRGKANDLPHQYRLCPDKPLVHTVNLFASQSESLAYAFGMCYCARAIRCILLFACFKPHGFRCHRRQ